MMGEDARTLPVKRNAAGERFRTLQAVADSVSQEDFPDWCVDGPRTTMWWIQQAGRLGTGLVARHHTWRHENAVQEESKNGVLHEVLSEALELLLCVDQVDAPNLAGCESMVRHLQFVEHEVKRRQDNKREADGSEFFLGRTKRTGGALVCPALLEWVAKKASQESAVLKEARKAAEERALARKGDKAGK